VVSDGGWTIWWPEDERYGVPGRQYAAMGTAACGTLSISSASSSEVPQAAEDQSNFMLATVAHTLH
jgi:hypothetical protein